MANRNEVLTDDEDFLGLVDAVLHPRMPRNFRERLNHFDIWNETEFFQRFRLTKDVVRHIIEIIPLETKSKRNCALIPAEMVLLTLRFLATGSFLQVVGDFVGVDKSIASRVVNIVTRAIASLPGIYINMPNQNDNIVRQKFFNICHFSRCIGAIDCTHIRIQSPGGEAEIYRNRKGYYSFNIQAFCDADLQIRDIVYRWPGSAHDANIFKNSNLRRCFEMGEFGDTVLIGDTGYGIKRYLITPLKNPVSRAENLFNESLIRTRNTIESCFGVWKRRFPILAFGIKLKIQKVEAVVVCCAVLHNIACQFHNEVPNVDAEIETALPLGNIPIEPQQAVQNAANNAVRHGLIADYFQNLQ